MDPFSVIINVCMDCVEEIKSLVLNYEGKLNARSSNRNWWISIGKEHLFDYIHNNTLFLPSDALYRERIYCILNGIKERILCDVCGKDFVPYSNVKRRYQSSCGMKCAVSKKSVTEKKKETLLKKHGVSSTLDVEGAREKAKATYLAKYGETHSGRSLIVQEKRRNTILEKYGVNNAAQKHILADSYDKLNNKDWLLNSHHVENKSMMQIAQELGVTYKTVRSYLDKYGIKFKYFWTSLAEKEIYNFLTEDLGIDGVVQNDRKTLYPKELDIHIPHLGLAIEHNGMYWHSFNKKETEAERLLHFSKLEDCSSKCISLLQIFETEWIDAAKKEVWKSIISNRVGKNSKIYARKCTVREISYHVASTFLEANHLQGKCVSSFNLGLYLGDDLVSVMTFSHSRFNKNHEWELARFCNKLYTRVVGGASRLFSYFESKKKPKSIISYCDLRHGNGKLYDALGFTWSHRSDPNYFYFNPNTLTLESRVAYQKHKLSLKLVDYDSEKTEAENMFANGYRRIWDCGNLVFVKKYQIPG